MIATFAFHIFHLVIRNESNDEIQALLMSPFQLFSSNKHTGNIMMLLSVAAFVCLLSSASATLAAQQNPGSTQNATRDACVDSILSKLGSDHNASRAFMQSFNDIYKGDGYSACGTTQFLTSLLISRKLQDQNVNVNASVHQTIDSQYATMNAYMQKGVTQPADERIERIESLKSTILQPNTPSWRPTTAACYFINYDHGTAHTFVLQRESQSSFRVWQSFVREYDVYTWISQNLSDRIKADIDKKSEYAGSLDQNKMVDFIDNLDLLLSGKVPWDEAHELHRRLFWSPSIVKSDEPVVFNFGCDLFTDYDVTQDCDIGFDHISREFKSQK